MVPSPTSQHRLDDLQHKILLNEALLASLEGDDTEESQQDRVTIQEKLRDLNTQLKSHGSIPNWGAPAAMGSPASRWVDTGPSSSGSEDASALTPNSDGNMAPPDRLALPSRKRQRNNGDDIDRPDSKSLRPSPAISAPPSPASTTEFFDFDFSDDPVSQSIFGPKDRQEVKEGEKKYFDELEKKRKQEKEDEEFARKLEQSENVPQFTAPPVQRPPSFNYNQTVFAPDGSSYRRMPLPEPPAPVTKPEHPSYPFSAGLSSQFGPLSNDAYTAYAATPNHGLPSLSAWAVSPNGALLPSSNCAPLLFTPLSSMNGAMPRPISLTDSDSEIEEISASDFSPHARQQQQRPPHNGVGFQPAGKTQNLPFASGRTMPGAFPGTGFAGNSVYGNNTPSIDPFSIIDRNMAELGYNIGSDMDPYTSRMLQDHFSDPTKTEEELRELIKHIRPDEEISKEEREGTPEQIKFPLMEHQKLGLTWMKKMEESSNKGGILADDMGLGKTIQALSLIVSRPPPPGVRKPTLVVAPVALMEQWKREAEKMVKPEYALKVFILHGSQRQTSWNVLKYQDVVLTTYGTIASELKRKVAWDQKLKMYPEARQTTKDYCAVLGDQSRFHRVILDEAQWIKNKLTKSAVAACYIQCEYRWCMTGTPMQNNVEELYSLIKFCRIRPYNEDARFSRDFTRPLKMRSQVGRDKAMRTLQALLKAILLRRTKTSTIDGKPILTLPPKTTTEARAVFSDDERDFYKALEGKAQLQFNKYLKAGTVGRNYSNVLVLLLRLRQACCHPHLIKDFAIHTGATMEGVDLLENARTLPRDAIERIKDNEDGAFECPVCLDAAENPVIFNPCGHTLCNECLARLVDSSTQNGEGGEPICPHCRAKINTSKVTDYTHFLKMFCPERLPENEVTEVNDEATASEDSDESSDEGSDDDDADLKDFIVDDNEIELDDDIDDDDDEDENEETPFEKSAIGKSTAASKSKKVKTRVGKKSKKSKKGKGKEKAVDNHKSLAQLRREGLKNKAAKKKYIKRLKKDFQTSAKIERTLELLETIHSRETGEKTIIFSGFTSFLDLLEVPLHRHPNLSNYARYDGTMPPKSRNEAVLEFTSNQHCKVMLVSLKAGNAGLNLTAASQVIILDPHWNPFVEMQAADRAYRIGQMRPVEVHRILVSEEGMDVGEDGTATVEDRILLLQEKKRQLVESALDENAGNSIARLGVRELGYLFGVNSMNGN